MPSPIGHALGGLIAGWLVAGPKGPTVLRSSARNAAQVLGKDAASLGGHAAQGAGEHATPSTGFASAPFRNPLGRALAFAALGTVADLDLLLHRHSQFTHSVGAALIVFGLAAALWRGRRGWLVLALAVGAAYASHPFLDWLGEDATPPLGITALWPFSREYFFSHANIFWGISREPWKPGMVQHDLLAILREIAILAPLALVAWWVRRSGSGRAEAARQGVRSRGVAGRGGESRHAQ